MTRKKKLNTVQAMIVEHIANNPTYIIGVDIHDKKALSYSLCRKVNNKLEILLCKTTSNEQEFNQDVRVLSRCFEANVYLENQTNE